MKFYFFLLSALLCTLGFSNQTSCLTDFKDHYENKQFAEALKVGVNCPEVIETPEYTFQLGRCHLFADDYAGARKYYRIGAQKEPKNEEMLNGMGASFLMESRYDSARYYFEGLVANYPKNLHGYYNLGVVNVYEEHYDEAIKAAKLHTANYPDDKLGWSLLGDAYFYTEGKENLAKIAYKKALSLDPKSSEDYFGLAYCHYILDEYDDALKQVNKAIRIEKIAEYYILKGDIYYYRPDANEIAAIKYYKKGISIDEVPIYYTYLGIAYHDADQYQNAVIALKKSIQMGVEDYECYEVLASSYFELKNYNAAVVATKKSTELNEDNYYPHYLGSLALIELDRMDQALKEVNSAIKKSSGFEGYLHYLRAWISVEKGDYQAAVEDLTKILNTEENYATAYFLRGKCYAEQDFYSKAIDDLGIYLDVYNAQDSEAYLIRAACHHELGNDEACCEDAKAAAKLGDSEAEKYVQRYCN